MRRPVPTDTQDRQARAAHPAASAWVSANAGSGKTHVLAQRVIRLLLDGVAPSKILCLTFTKAAAANMSMRVFDTLSAWTRLDDGALAAAIIRTGLPKPDRTTMLRARRLFARAVETPGGLKIQTIHAFCERLLHLFPFEANVAAGFEVLAEAEQAELLAAARAQTLVAAVTHEESPLAQAVRTIAAETSEGGFGDLIAEALGARAAIVDSLNAHGGDIGQWRAALARHLGLGPDETEAAIEGSILQDGFPPARWKAIAAAFKNCQDGLASAAACEGETRRDAYVQTFLTQKLEPRKRLILKNERARSPDLSDEIDAEQDRLVAVFQRLGSARLVERSAALVLVVNEILRAYAHRKAMRGRLDFEDLIERTRTLLSRAGAGWVLYKLDAGIDHILVDEAQDTSPAQWDILRILAEEFTSGAGARKGPRTFFAVGDEKQSIYSFQGAAPDMFDDMRRFFGARVRKARQDFEDVRLTLSFRSVPEILKAVDRVFASPANYEGVVAQSDDVAPVHEALKSDLPGLVEIWNLEAPQTIEDPRDWEMPLDRLGECDPPVAVARRIAGEIGRWLAPDTREAVHGEDGLPRKIAPGDVLVLVRTRGAFFDAVIRALKDNNVPVAGADRLVLTDHIAVMDLIAAGRASLLPEDDLALACLLKSPLVGLDDDDLIALAPRREGSLAGALAASPDARHQKGHDRLAHWRKAAMAATPFRFYADLLGPDGGRRRMLARLGPEAGDAIDEFLRLALRHERAEAPSLTSFLHELESADLSIKRDMEAAGDSVRVMTVHAAKGLEAKIVFLPDTCGEPSGRHDPALFALRPPVGAPFMAWSRGKATDPASLADERTAHRARQEAEYRRLLYVAMTRAEERLYIAGFHGARQPGARCWYNLMRAELEPQAAIVPAPDPQSPERTVLRIGEGARIANAQAPLAAGPTGAAPPAWLAAPAPFEAPVPPPVSPSSALAAADQLDAPTPGGPAPEAARRGRLIHALLQYLPGMEPARRGEAATRFLDARAGDLPDAERAALTTQALALFADPQLAPLFAAGSQAEISIAARIPRPGRAPLALAGQIDRLAVTAEAVLIADYKTGRRPASDDAPGAYAAQLALYRAAIAPLYPHKEVRAMIVWTAEPGVQEIAPAALDAALARVLA